MIEEALQKLDEQVLWQEIHAAYAEDETEAMRSERALCDCTVNDGLMQDHW